MLKHVFLLYPVTYRGVHSLFIRADIKTATSLRFDLVDFNVEITFPDEKNLIETYDPVDNC